MRLPSFSEWIKAREEVSLAYGGGYDVVGNDKVDPNRYAGIKSKYHTFDGDEEALENLGKRRGKGPKEPRNPAKSFGFAKNDPLLKIQSRPGGIGDKKSRE
jgi:hypothetical protein